MKQVKYFFINLSFLIVISCSSGVTPQKSVIENLSAGDLISSSADTLLSMNQKSLEVTIDQPDSASLSPAEQNKLDSIYTKLMQDKEVLIDEKDRNIYKALMYMNLKDTTYLTNIYMKTPRDGSVKSYQYDVLKNDEIFYSIENLDGNSVEEISILEGEVFRYVKQKFPKKSKEEGQLKIISDNTLTLNIENSNFFKNKGVFGSDLKITLKKVSPLYITYEEVIDSIPSTEEVIKVVNDTLYEASYIDKLTLAPLLDITEKHKLVFPIDILPKEKELVGWGYWVGLNPEDSLDWSSDQDNDIINFAQQEFFNKEGKVSLQNSENDHVMLKINNNSLDVRTLNYAGNYAFYLTDKKIDKPHRRAEIIIQNLSAIYSYTIALGVVSVYFKPREVLTEEELFTQKKRIKLTLGTNE